MVDSFVTESTLLGRPLPYWASLECQVRQNGVPPRYEALIIENVKLRGELDFIKSRLKEIDIGVH